MGGGGSAIAQGAMASRLRLGCVLTLLAALPPGAGAEALDTPEALLRRSLSHYKSGDKQLARGYLSLALHLDPFMRQDPAFAWIEKAVKNEPMHYWQGNAFVGHDKTYLESLFSRADLFQDQTKTTLLLYTWRSVELTGLSCCGVDNMAVYFQRSGRHMYVAPFVDLVPGYAPRLTPDNKKMYDSFKQWWQSTGSRPMPDPPVSHMGEGRFEWSTMKVAMKASRLPDSWNDLIQAVLLYRLSSPDEARTCLRLALAANAELAQHASELMPRLQRAKQAQSVVQAVARPEEKYVINYNPHVGLGNLAVVMTSANLLAKLTGRTFVLNWNVNTVVQHAFKLREGPKVISFEGAVDTIGVAPENVKNIYFFHMMNSPDLGRVLELFGCADLPKALDEHRVVTVSSNLFFAPLLAVNPNVPAGIQAGFPEMLEELFEPSDAAAARALDYAMTTDWGKTVPVVAVHIRAREEGEDNDDWPTASSPDLKMLKQLRKCIEHAVAKELPRKQGLMGLWSSEPEWDVFIAATTEKARQAAARALAGAKGLRNILQIPSLVRDRRSKQGTVDAMAEALLVSRASVFMRMVVGTSGFSTFAYFSNALRRQNSWVEERAPHLVRDGFAPNYVITADCGTGRCYRAPADVRMASIDWHGAQYTHRSCGDVLKKAHRDGTESLGCRGLKDIDKVASGEL